MSKREPAPGTATEPRMMLTPSVKAAFRYAQEHGLSYSWSVLAAGWFVGTDDQLRAIGCIDIRSAGTSPEDIGHVQA